MNQVKREAEQRGKTVTTLIEEGLRLVLAQAQPPDQRNGKASVLGAGGGVLPGVDLNDSAALEDIMDGHGRPWVILPDVNVLVYAFRSDAENHSAYRRWLEDIVNGEQAYGMSPQVLASVIRITTHPRIFAHPDPLADVLAFVTVLLDQPHCQIIEPGPSPLGHLHRLMPQSKCVRKSGPGRLACGTGDRIGLRMDHQLIAISRDLPDCGGVCRSSEDEPWK